jgi:hypothetical protein
MPPSFEPKKGILPEAQQQIWAQLAPARHLGFVLYGGTAVALHFGHRRSVDFDFFRSEALKKNDLRKALPFLNGAETLQEEANTLIVQVIVPAGPVKLSFFGGINFGRVADPLETSDGVLLVASISDLMATKLKTILDRAEAKDYVDIAALLNGGASLERGLGAFQLMFKEDASLPLKAIGFFKGGDLSDLPERIKTLLRDHRDRVSAIPKVTVKLGSLAR